MELRSWTLIHRLKAVCEQFITVSKSYLINVLFRALISNSYDASSSFQPRDLDHILFRSEVTALFSFLRKYMEVCLCFGLFYLLRSKLIENSKEMLGPVDFSFSCLVMWKAFRMNQLRVFAFKWIDCVTINITYSKRTKMIFSALRT